MHNLITFLRPNLQANFCKRILIVITEHYFKEAQMDFAYSNCRFRGLILCYKSHEIFETKRNSVKCLQKFARRFGLHFSFPTLILQQGLHWKSKKVVTVLFSKLLKVHLFKRLFLSGCLQNVPTDLKSNLVWTAFKVRIRETPRRHVIYTWSYTQMIVNR